MEHPNPASLGTGRRSASEALTETALETGKHAELAGQKLKNAALAGDLGAASSAATELALKVMHVSAGLVEELTPSSGDLASLIPLPTVLGESCAGARPGRTGAGLESLETASPSQRLLETASGLAASAQQAIDQLPPAQLLVERIEKFIEAEEAATFEPESVMRRRKR